MSYIEREPLLEILDGLYEHHLTMLNYAADGATYDCITAVKEAPTADVVEVVRCRDCAHYHEMKGFDYKGRKAHHCVWHSALRGENDYCSDGIRRSENER